jgi:O-antigen/teichoic acid export membrane protein
MADRPVQTHEPLLGAQTGVLDEPVRRLVRGGVLNLLGAVTFGIGSFLFFVAVARSLPADKAGALFEAIALFILLIWIGNLGTPIGLARRLPHARTLRRFPELRPTVLIAIIPVAAFSTLLGGAVFLAAPELAPLIARRADPETATTYIRVISLLVPFGATLTTVLGATQALGTMVPTNAIENLLQPVARLLLAAGIALGATGSLYVPLAWTLPAVAGLVVGLPWLGALVRRSETGVAETGARSVRTIAREFWVFTSVRAFGTIIQMALIWLDVLLVGALASAREAGVYAVATRYVIAGTLINTALLNVFAPEVSASFARRNIREVKHLYQKATLWVMAASLPLYFLMAIYAPLLVKIFGPAFESGQHALIVLSLAMCLSMMVGPVMAVLLMGGRSAWNIVDVTTALVLNIGANVVLVPRFGITGAAVAYGASILVFNALPLAQVFHWWRLHPFDRGHALLLGLCLACFGGLAVALRIWIGPTLTGFVAALSIGAVSYVAALWLLRSIIDLGLSLPFRFRHARVSLAGRPPST